MTVFAFWFDSNKEQHYPFLGTRVIRWSRFFLNDFTTRVNSYIGTTIVVPDDQYIDRYIGSIHCSLKIAIIMIKHAIASNQEEVFRAYYMCLKRKDCPRKQKGLVCLYDVTITNYRYELKSCLGVT